MGLGSCAAKVMPKLDRLTHIDVVDIGRGILHDSGSGSHIPTMDADCNNVINIVGRKALDPVNATAQHLKSWAQRGLIVTPICDGDRRPDAKQASNNNIATREKGRNKAITSRQELNAMNQRLKVELLNEEQRNKLLEERDALERRVKSSETQSTNVVPRNFADLLEECLCKIDAHAVNEVGGYVANVQKAEFQADALMGGRFKEGTSQLLLSNDADMRVNNGDGCVCVTGMTGREITVSSSSRKTLEKVKSYLDPKSQEIAKVVVAKKGFYPIFEGIESLRLRALISVIVGCDVCPGGIKDFGPKAVETKLEELRQSTTDEGEIYDQLLDCAVEFSQKKPTKFSKEDLTTFVQGVIYEPTNAAPPEGTSSLEHRTYLGDAPTTLPSYLQEFWAPATTIEQGPEILQCKGARSDGSAGHPFLAAVDHHECASCGKTVCRLCTGQIGEEHYCLGCHLVETLLPGISPEDIVSIKDMREDLRTKYRVNEADSLSIKEVEEIWESHAIHRAIEEMADDLEFPVLPAEAIQSGDCWEDLAEIDFSYGGAFLLDAKIGEENIPEILELLAAFVYFDTDRKKYTTWQKDGSVFAAMPELFIKFADKTESIDNKTAKLIRYKDQLGIHLSCKIPASMKKDVYDGDTVLTKDTLVCAQCECKSGAKKKERVACVHTAPRAMMLSILLAEDLAEHVLITLASIVTSAYVEEDTWSKEQIESMKRSAVALARGSKSNRTAEEMAKSATLYQMMQKYRTGTQKTNEWRRQHKPPKKDEIGPIADMDLDSPEQKAQLLFNRTKPTVKKSLPESIAFEPNYVQSGLLMNAAGIDPSEFGVVGFKLHEYRRNCQAREGPQNQNDQSHELLAAERKWKALVEESTHRSTRRSQTQLANILPQQRPRPSQPASRKRPNESSPTGPQKKRPSGHKAANTCAKCGNTSDTGARFHRIPPYPADLDANATLRQKISHRGRVWLRQEVMDRAGFGRDDRKEELRVCSEHEVETKRESLEFTHNGRKYHQLYEFTLISGAGPKSSLCPSTHTKGVAKERFAQRQLNVNDEKRKRGGPHCPATAPSRESALKREKRRRIEAEADAASWRRVAQQLAECSSVDDNRQTAPMCPSTSTAAGLVAPKEAPAAHPNAKRLFKVRAIGEAKQSTSSSDPKSDKPKKPRKPRLSTQPPKVLLRDTETGQRIDEDEVKRRTGFDSLNTLLAYIILINNGDVDRIRRRHSPLTWFEEYFLFFEWKMNETTRRQKDVCANWGLDSHQVITLKDSMLAAEREAVLSWPTFASYEEDRALRDREKWSRYDEHRTIMWDMTNVTAVQFGDASLQRSTYNEYYGENCFKGGVGLQFCGWQVNWNLWTGFADDSRYHDESGYSDEQKSFQETDLVNGEVKPFLNVLDRGYRVTYAAHQTGGQMVLQPPGSKSERRFKGRETVFAACVAHDRSGNERGVNVSKRAGLFKRGFKQGMNAERFNAAWRTWGFQANFMYKPVL
ncbi:hypothetical protein ACHAXT_012880 [Thalassiosira profunda]